jgi:hypothetical protein
MAGNFYEDNKKGKITEAFAKEYFKKLGITYKDVSNDKEYQKIDSDFLTDKYGKVEVKRNYHDAKYGKPGYYFWIELELDNEKRGWWYKSTADHFLFLQHDGKKGIIIKNDDIFKNYINNAIDNGSHSSYGDNRFDPVKDERYGRYIDVLNMRVYTADVPEEINLQKLTKRSKI